MNLELTRNNHMVWGYNGIPWSHRTNIYDNFFINYGKTNETGMSFREACVNSAKEISAVAESLNKIPLIFYSGGIDSEAMIVSFIESKVNFKVAHVRYLPNYNEHETFYVRKFAESHGIEILEYSVDVLDFLSAKSTFDTAVRDGSSMIELHLLTAITDNIKDLYFPVLDHPGTYLYRNTTDLSKRGKWYWKDYEFIMFYYNYCCNENLPACPSFFHWSPEIILSFLTDPEIYNLVNNRQLGKITNRTTTTALYQKTFPEYNLEIRKKYTGFEFIPKDFLHKINTKLRLETKCSKVVGQVHEYHEMLGILGYDY
jgi:hypothetical protein